MNELSDLKVDIDNQIRLTTEDVAVLVDAINNPPEPNDALKKAFGKRSELLMQK